MRKNLLNYTTDIPVHKTIAEIQEELARIRARSIMFDYNDAGLIEAISFKVIIKNEGGDEQELAFRLPAKVEEAYQVIYKTRLAKEDEPTQERYKPGRMEQAAKVAWRIVKDWLEVQAAIIELQMAKVEEIFLPYLLVGGNKTLFQAMEQSRFALPSGTVEGEIIEEQIN